MKLRNTKKNNKKKKQETEKPRKTSQEYSEHMRRPGNRHGRHTGGNRRADKELEHKLN